MDKDHLDFSSTFGYDGRPNGSNTVFTKDSDGKVCGCTFTFVKLVIVTQFLVTNTLKVKEPTRKY